MVHDKAKLYELGGTLPKPIHKWDKPTSEKEGKRHKGKGTDIKMPATGFFSLFLFTFPFSLFPSKMNALFFWLFSGGMIRLRARRHVLNRNAVASALCFTFTIVFMAGLFVMLSAFFLAAVQILVTAGAVMVLFLFIIMLLDLTAMEHMPRQKTWMACSFLLAIGFHYHRGQDAPRHAGRSLRTVESLPAPGSAPSCGTIRAHVPGPRR